MSASIPPEIRPVLARCMAQIELEWGRPDAELRAILGVPADAPIGTKPQDPQEPSLLPCPFCGSEPILSAPAVALGYAAQVGCTGCRALVLGYGKEEVTAAWNRRHSAAALRCGEITLNEAREQEGLPPLNADTLAAMEIVRNATGLQDRVVEIKEVDEKPHDAEEPLFQEVDVRGARQNSRKTTILRLPWHACCAWGRARHFDLRAVAETPEEAAMLFGPPERMDFEEAHLIIGERCVPWVLTPGQIEQIVAGGGVPC